MIKLTIPVVAASTGATTMRASEWISPLQAAIDKYNINTPARVAAFLAQLGVESGHLTALEENLNCRADTLCRVWPKRYRKALPGESLDTKMFYDGMHNADFYANRPQDIANLSYGGRMGNGEATTGDGWKYRGRGLIQVSGKNNYKACSSALGADFVATPDLLATKNYAALSAGWFWNANRLNELADALSIDAISKRVNGGSTGMVERRTLYQQGMKAFVQ